MISRSRSSGVVSSTNDTCSNTTGCSHLQSTCSFTRNSCACSSIGSNARSIASNYDYIAQNCPCCRESQSFRSSLCPKCKPSRAPTVPANLCSSCGGKISLQESPNSSGGSVQPAPATTVPGTAIRLCNCFPKFPSQPSVVTRSGSANVINPTSGVPVRPMSVDQIEATCARRSVASLTSNFEAFFNSHLGIPGAPMRP